MMTNPIYPSIKKGPPRFVDAKKSWHVDVGAVLRDSEHTPGLDDGSVLYQSRDYNKMIYGQSSHRSYVNQEFRPPIVEPNLIIYPLHRQPRDPIVPRMNPGAAGTFEPQNLILNTSEFQKEIVRDKIKPGMMNTNFYHPTGNIYQPETPLTTTQVQDIRQRVEINKRRPESFKNYPDNQATPQTEYIDVATGESFFVKF